MSYNQYDHHDVRVVSDLSRFEFESPTPKNRSRNPTPPSIIEKNSFITHHSPSVYDDEIVSPPKPPFVDPGPQRSRNLIEIAESSMLPKVRPNATYDYEDIYKYYEKQSNSSLTDVNNPTEFVPYPASVRDEPINNQLPYHTNSLGIPSLPDQSIKSPLTNQTSFMQPTSATLTNNNMVNNNHDKNNTNIPDNQHYKDKDLPPIMDTAQYYQFTKNPSNDSIYKSHDSLSLSSKQKIVENQLVKSVMNRPLWSFQPGNMVKGDESFEGRSVTITANFLIYLFEMIIAMIIIILSSVLLSEDHKMGVGFYRYFIVESAISMFISLLFMSTIVNFERRNGSFYVTAACILSLVSFIMTISSIIPNDNCETKSVCSLRKANSAFIIISFFLWLTDLVMFATTLYISRLNLLSDINFDYSNRGLEKGFNRSISDGSTVNFNQQQNDDLLDPRSGQELKQYYLNEIGEMYELTDEFDVRGKNKIIVYTAH